MVIKFLNEDVNPDSPHCNIDYVSRYMALENALLSLPKEKHIRRTTYPLFQWFSNPETWDDPFEKFFLNNSFKDNDCPLKDHVAIACYTTKTASEAQWTVYSKKEIAVQMRINWAGLIEGLEAYDNKDYRVYIGKVHYQDTCVIKKPKLSSVLEMADGEIQKMEAKDEYELPARLMTIKRSAYSYEEEIRIMIVSTKNEVSRGLNIGPFKKDIIDRVTISTHAGKETTNVLKQVFHQRGIKRVYHSTLYDPVVNIVLE